MDEAGSTGFYQVLLVLRGFTGLDEVLLGSTGVLEVLQGSAQMPLCQSLLNMATFCCPEADNLLRSGGAQ